MTPLTEADQRHGSLTGYASYGCKCDPCKAAGRLYRKQRRERLGPQVLTEEQKRRNRERARQWALDNPERYKAKQAEAYQRKAEQIKERLRLQRLQDPEGARAKDRARTPKRKDRKAEYDKGYRAANAEKIRTAKAEWVKSPQGRASVNANSARRRARLKQQDCGCATKDELIKVWEYDHGRCYLCGGPGASFDHVLSLANGGLHCVANLRVACRSCNSSKSHRSLEYVVELLEGRGIPLSPCFDLPALPCPKELQ